MLTYLDNAARRRIRDPSKQARRNSTIIATRLSRDPTGLSTTNPLQWSVGVVIRTILGTGNCLATKGRKGNKNSGRVKGKRKRERGRKKRQSRCGMSPRVVFWPSYPGYLDHFIRQNCRPERRGEASLSYGHENYIAGAKWRTKGAASFRKLGGRRRKRGVTRRDSSRASFREIFHSTPRRPCYPVPRDKDKRLAS